MEFRSYGKPGRLNTKDGSACEGSGAKRPANWMVVSPLTRSSSARKEFESRLPVRVRIKPRLTHECNPISNRLTVCQRLRQPNSLQLSLKWGCLTPYSPCHQHLASILGSSRETV